MGLGSRTAIAARFEAYVGELTKVIGHAARKGPLRDYCAGLLATEGRRSVRSRFARVRVRAAPIRGEARFAEEMLLIE